MYALVFVLFSDAVNSIVSTGQAHTVYGAAQEATKNRLRGAGAIRHWSDNARPSGAPQGHAGVAG